MINIKETLLCVLLTIFFYGIVSGLTPSTFLTNADQLRLKKTFSTAFPPTDLITAHYATLGYSLLNEKVPASEDVCKFFDSKIDKKRLDTIFHASTGGKLLNCKLTVAGLQQVLDAIIKEDSSMQDIYYAVLSLKNLNLKIDYAKVHKVLSAYLKKDDNIINVGYAFHAASVLQKDYTEYVERIEDVIVQADEVDSKYLQFEGGLGITATIVSGMYKLSEVAKTAPAITPEQAIKFTNYFLSRKFVQTVKGAAQLLEILNIFATNKYHIPVAVTLASNGALSEENPSIEVRITNVLGASLGPLTVTLETAKKIGSDASVMSKKSFQPVKGSNILYTFNYMESKPNHGFYNVTINAVPAKADPKLIGNTQAPVYVKVLTEVAVEGAEIGSAYLDQVSSAKTTRIVYPQETVHLEVDNHQRLFMKFSLKDKKTKLSLTAHQAFVMFMSQKTKQEIVFVAEPDSSSVYRFDMDFAKNKEKEFQFSSGTYDIHLIIGDPLQKNPFMWKMGQVVVSLPSGSASESTEENPYAAQPEIKHMFREKEKVPSSFVCNTFSALCVAPLLLLLILWIKLGANLSNFPCSLYAAGFHLGLLTIFGLFMCFWVHLDMFNTLKYLLGLGLFTYLTGHKLLSKLAAEK